jgi:AcrR family transcriptional regulator
MSRNEAATEPRAPDRRVRRTRQALRDALIDLIVERGYPRVTVQDVIDRADVGRSTFYSHYRDKDDLLLSSLDEQIRAAFTSDVGGVDASPSLWVFTHAASHADLYRALIRRRGGWTIVRRQMEETLAEMYERQLPDPPADTPVPRRAAARFLAGALVALTAWWLDEGMPLDPASMDDVFRTLATKGAVEDATRG